MMIRLDDMLEQEWLGVLQAHRTPQREMHKAYRSLEVVDHLPKTKLTNVDRWAYLETFNTLCLAASDRKVYEQIALGLRALADQTRSDFVMLGKRFARRLEVKPIDNHQQAVGNMMEEKLQYRLYAHVHPEAVIPVYEDIINALAEAQVPFASKVMTDSGGMNVPGHIAPQYNSIVLFVTQESGRVALQRLAEKEKYLLKAHNPFTARVLDGVGVAESLMLGRHELRTSFDVPKRDALWSAVQKRKKAGYETTWKKALDLEMVKRGRDSGRYHVVDKRTRGQSREAGRLLHDHLVETLREEYKRRTNDGST